MFITAPVGMLMGMSMDMLFYCLVGMGVLLWLDIRMLFGRIREEAKENEEGEELNEILKK